VLLDGADICAIDVLTLRRKVGMLFQLPAMFDGTSDSDSIRRASIYTSIKLFFSLAAPETRNQSVPIPSNLIDRWRYEQKVLFG
jgi:hypothetical protein